MPAWFSPITVANHPNTMKTTIAAPPSMMSLPAPAPFRRLAKPNISVNRPTEPTMGQRLP
jgi:hypothetical protein